MTQVGDEHEIALLLLDPIDLGYKPPEFDTSTRKTTTSAM